MKYPFRIFLAILSVFVLTLSACSNRDASKIQEAEKMIVANPDSAMTMLREVVNPHLLPDSTQALYWLCIAIYIAIYISRSLRTLWSVGLPISI
jgi:hypothetical protein